MMKDAIKNFNQQLAFEPIIENEVNLQRGEKFIVVGMGGSHLPAGLVKIYNPLLELRIHRNYGLPDIPEEELKQYLVILSSYSGNTEEVIDAFGIAKDLNLNMAVISVGGELLDLAKSNNIPFIQMPDTGIQPRSALGYSLKALLKLLGDDEALSELNDLGTFLNPESIEAKGQDLANRLTGFVPVVYASNENMEIAYNWKVKFNETGKIPAFANRFPELNHNEMTGFDAIDSTRDLSRNFYFIILRDEDDDPRILKRMEVLTRLYQDRGFNVEIINFEGQSLFERIFFSLILADWAAYYTAENYGAEPEQVPMVEEFKGLIKE